MEFQIEYNSTFKILLLKYGAVSFPYILRELHKNARVEKINNITGYSESGPILKYINELELHFNTYCEEFDIVLSDSELSGTPKLDYSTTTLLYVFMRGLEARMK